ncbi:hypothetical protein LGN17_01770 [Burkholderia sp. AU30280]|uniref:hypothetical protein n=1 Tax=Burkholderia sp. AU30280 TaxID=2879628 RepID=UPI001CF1B5D3|nr:hypothetical protein [Burkholderia sp. AU30280]MCA8271251.1 hypothetical protein [Burkholderia sp. AU30280]
MLRRSRRHAALGIRQDTDITARCKLRAQPAAPRGDSPLATLPIDHYGLMGLAQRLATPGRIAGVAPIFAGMIVVQWQAPAPRVPATTGDAAPAPPEPQR